MAAQIQSKVQAAVPGCLGQLNLAGKPGCRVLLCCHASQEACVLKITENIRREVEALERLSNPFIVKLLGHKENEYIIMEAALGGPLQRHLRANGGQFEVSLARCYAAQLAVAISYMHSRSVMHRDIKLSNCVLDRSNRLKLIDFGAAAIVASSRPNFTFCGTPHCMSPEMITRSGHSYGVDWWALGILFTELLTGIPPFWHQDNAELSRRILKGEAGLPHQDKCGPSTLLALRCLLDRNPSIRARAYNTHYAGFGLESIAAWTQVHDRLPVSLPTEHRQLGYVDWYDDIIADQRETNDDDGIDHDVFIGF